MTKYAQELVLYPQAQRVKDQNSSPGPGQTWTEATRYDSKGWLLEDGTYQPAREKEEGEASRIDVKRHWEALEVEDSS